MKKLFICIAVLLVTGFDHQNDPIDLLALNAIQVIGSHNSYKQALDPEILAYLKKERPSAAQSLDYSHISIKEQLDMGLLNLELDVYADTKGGTYANPQGLTLLQDKNASAAYDPEGVLARPGFKTIHVQEIDFRSECLAFEQCLLSLKTWSDANKGHFPIFVTINAKDAESSLPDAVVPEQFTSKIFDQLDEVILSTLGMEKLLIPEDIKGQYATLESAVLDGNWPLVKSARGKFIFILDEQDRKRAAYIENHPSLAGRVMFANAEPGTPEAAILIMNNPVGQQAAIQEMVKKGYIVRTRADANTTEARNNDGSRFSAAQQSGAQIITTDYYQPSTHFKSDYKVNFKNGKYIRANPLLSKNKR
jgi:hypothetical protein